MSDRRSAYLGHDSQLYGVEEHRLVGGRGDGMRLLQVRNGLGLEATISADRCADLSRVSFQGCNMGFFSPCGYVAPAYYDDRGSGFLKSFTTGFLTTCGLRAVGAACQDEGEALPMHGTISNTPAECVGWETGPDAITVSARMTDAVIFGDKLVLERRWSFSMTENAIELCDTVTNAGDRDTPLMILYHFNIGYPLLSETAQLWIPSDHVAPRDEEAAKGIASWNKVLTPQVQYREQCFYHTFSGSGCAGIYQPELQKGVCLRFDPQELGSFTQWKMMGVRDYVMGLEPGNCTPDGRDVLRRENRLQWIAPGERRQFHLRVEFLDHPFFSE